MSQVDWSKAPEGATHYSEQVPGHSCAAFWREQDGRLVEFWGEYSVGKFTHLANPRGYAKLPSDCVPRPSPAWSGEGLPPVGVACEYFDNKGVWRSAVMSHIGSHLFIVKYQHSELGEQEACMNIADNDTQPSSRLRPIRTPEQIAAEEREAAIEELRQLLSSVACDDYHAAVAMIDAGYRKQADTK